MTAIGDFNTPLSKIDRSSKQNINKDIVALNNALDEMDLTDIYRAFHPKEPKYTFFSNAHGICSDRQHDRTQNKPQQVQIIEIISGIFSDHKGLKLETNLKEKTPKHSKTWRLNSMLSNNEWVKKEIRTNISEIYMGP